MYSPLVSICIPTYNGAQYLSKAMDSAINQTYTNIEILIVDDQSTDQTLEIVKGYQKKDSRISYYQNEKNIGLVGNWNTCLKKAKGEWIQFLFQDDLLERDSIEKKLALASQYNTSLVLAERNFLFSPSASNFSLAHNDKLSNFFKEEQFVSPNEIGNLLIKKYLKSNFIGEPIIGLFKKELLQKYGHYNNTLKQVVDFEFWLRLGINEGFVYSPEAACTFRVHQGSTSNKNSKTHASLIDYLLIAQEIERNPHYEKLRVYYKTIGFDYLAKHDVLYQQNIRAWGNDLVTELAKNKHVIPKPKSLKTKIFLTIPLIVRRWYHNGRTIFIKNKSSAL